MRSMRGENQDGSQGGQLMGHIVLKAAAAKISNQTIKPLFFNIMKYAFHEANAIVRCRCVLRSAIRDGPRQGTAWGKVDAVLDFRGGSGRLNIKLKL